METLENLKKRLRRKYLGEAGIHGLGIDYSQNALRVYYEPLPDPEQEKLLKEIEKEAYPYRIIAISGEPPKITRPF